MGSLMGSYLFACPTFWSGAARLLDLGNTFDQYNHSPSGQEADTIGMLIDWDAIGQDLWFSYEDYSSEVSQDHHRQEAHLVSR